MFRKIRKRDGRIEDFDPERITNAIAKAGEATGEFDREIAKKNLDKITVVPNPYIVTNMMEPRIREGYNQQRRLLFNNLPAKCTIRIYTISGNLVKTIEVNNEYSNGSYHWDMLNNDGKEIGFGIYLYHVDAPGVGEHIGKFAIIK